MFHAFRILTFLLAGMGCGLAAGHMPAAPIAFIPETLWQLVGVLTWAALWIVYALAAAREIFRTIRDVFPTRKEI
jgi:hypothetical protein